MTPIHPHAFIVQWSGSNSSPATSRPCSRLTYAMRSAAAINAPASRMPAPFSLIIQTLMPPSCACIGAIRRRLRFSWLARRAGAV